MTTRAPQGLDFPRDLHEATYSCRRPTFGRPRCRAAASPYVASRHQVLPSGLRTSHPVGCFRVRQIPRRSEPRLCAERVSTTNRVDAVSYACQDDVQPARGPAPPSGRTKRPRRRPPKRQRPAPSGGEPPSDWHRASTARAPQRHAHVRRTARTSPVSLSWPPCQLRCGRSPASRAGCRPRGARARSLP